MRPQGGLLPRNEELFLLSALQLRVFLLHSLFFLNVILFYFSGPCGREWPPLLWPSGLYVLFQQLPSSWEKDQLRLGPSSSPLRGWGDILMWYKYISSRSPALGNKSRYPKVGPLRWLTLQGKYLFKNQRAFNRHMKRC